MARQIDLSQYVDVAERIRRFYGRYPEGSIQTEMVRLEGDMVIFRATVYRHPEDTLPTTGWAYERESQGYVNKTSYIENCETSAIGRAIANLGFTTRHEPRATREEMEKVQRMSAPATDDTRVAIDEALRVLERHNGEAAERARAYYESQTQLVEVDALKILEQVRQRIREAKEAKAA